MKQITLLIALLIAIISSVQLNAQWATAGIIDIYNTNLGNVGIGLSAPTSRLHVKGNLSLQASTAELKFLNGLTHHASIKTSSLGVLSIGTQSSNDDINFFSGSTNKITMDGPTGNLGLGTATPADKIHALGSIRMEASGNKYLRYVNGLGSTQAEIFVASDNLNLLTFTANADLRLGNNGVTQFEINNNGRVDVGGFTYSGGERLNVDGAIEISSANFSNPGVLQFDGSNFLGYNGFDWLSLSDTAVWKVNGNKAYFLDMTGIGTTNPQDALHIVDGDVLLEKTTGTAGAIGFRHSGIIQGTLRYENGEVSLNTFNSADIELHSDDEILVHANSLIALTADHALEFRTTSTGTSGGIYVATNGNVAIGGNSASKLFQVNGDMTVTGQIVHPSDKRLKENIQTIPTAVGMSGLSIVTQLQPKSYTYKSKVAKQFGLPANSQYGLIAQEVKNVVPEIVVEDALIDENGNKYMGIDYEKLIPILIEALKEEHQQKNDLALKVEDQNQRIGKLESVISQIEISKLTSK